MLRNRRPIYIAIILLSTTLFVKAAINQQRELVATNVAFAEKTELLAQTTQIQQSNNVVFSNGDIKIYQHIVKPGDTLEVISNTYQVSIDTIINSNDLTKDAQLKEGQVLEFPSIKGVLYKVKDGETIWDLALLNKVDFNKIIETNNLDNPDKLSLDQKIIFPDIEKVAAMDSKRSSQTASNSDKSSAKKLVVSTQSLSRGSMPTRGTITSKFGARWGKQHEGIDIAAPTGTNVYAFLDGKVTFSGWENGYGNLVVISHGNGLESYYGHNSKNVAKTGQVVKQGDHIAEVGSTGHATGPHTHFEVRKNGNPVNPFQYLK